MTIVGVGIDVVGIERFGRSLTRTPSLQALLFTAAEGQLPTESLAARFAAKEALAKALGSPGDLRWHDAEIRSLPTGQPVFALRGKVLERAQELGAEGVHVSMSHDADRAAAIVVLTTDRAEGSQGLPEAAEIVQQAKAPRDGLD